ncbi:MAG: hypothetical protein L6245_02840, partial [Thermodesulfovibrionales bacterium]|nr:hypothetical protein [Thermodesulfovibrionales bacterium]
MQERGRKGAVTRGAESAVPEIQAWMNSGKKGGLTTGQGALIEVDTNGDGTVVTAGASADLTNNALATAGIMATFTGIRNPSTTPPGLLAVSSPWLSASP